jgi:hypothetical protein
LFEKIKFDPPELEKYNAFEFEMIGETEISFELKR